MINESMNVFITGANRGIGFELTNQLANTKHNVIACYREENKSKRLFDESNRCEYIHPIKVDIRQELDLENAKIYIDETFDKLDLIINNAGININPNSKLSDINWSDIEKSFLTNIGGPFQTSKILYPLLKKGTEKKIINISSIMGSINLSNGGSTPYRLSKAGLNMLTKNQSLEYKQDGVIVVSIHPGWVKTGMGGDSAQITVEESARKIIQIINKITISNTGEFISINGDNIPF